MRQRRCISIRTSAFLVACAGLFHVQKTTAQLLGERAAELGQIDLPDFVAQEVEPSVQPKPPSIPHSGATDSSNTSASGEEPSNSQPASLPPPTGNIPRPLFQEPPSELNQSPSGLMRSVNAPIPAPVNPSPSDISLSDLLPLNRWHSRFGLIVSGTYDSNIFIQPRNGQSDYYCIVAPELAVGSGDFFQQLELRQQSFRLPDRFENADLVLQPSPNYLYLAYTPSYTAFVDHTNENGFDQDAILELQHRFTKLTLNGFARYQTVKIPDVDLGTRVSEQFTYAQATLTYDWTPKSKLTDQFYLQYRDYQVGVNALEMWDEFWYDYQITPKTRLGAGIAAGAIYPQAGPDQYYGRFQARATWNPTSRLKLAAKCGVEYRGVKNRGERAYPIFGLAADFNYSDRTSISLSASQTVTTSANQQELDYVARSVAIKFKQEILDRFRFDLSGGYQNLEYKEVFSARRGGFARTDNYFYVQPALNLTLLRWLSCELTFEFRKDASTQASKSFHQFLTGVQFNITF